MGLSVLTLALARKYTRDTVLGGGALVGKNVIISSIVPIENGNRVTFSYTLDDGTPNTSTMDVMNGSGAAAIIKAEINDQKELVFTLSDGTILNAGTISSSIELDNYYTKIETENLIDNKINDNMTLAENSDIDALFN
jgi:hypothetical protein